MTRAALYLLVFFGVSAALWGGVEYLKQRGRDEIAAALAISNAEQVRAAARRADETAAAMAKKADEDEAALIAANAELERLRHEREAAGGGDAIVFGPDYDRWLRKSCRNCGGR